MHVLVVAERVDAALDAASVGEAVAAGWGESAPWDAVQVLQQWNAEPGFLTKLADVLGGVTNVVTTSDPLGRPTPARIHLVASAGGRTAYLDAGDVLGGHLVAPADRDPVGASSAGGGRLIAAAMDLGATRVVVGVGSSLVTDGGLGLLAALAGVPESWAPDALVGTLADARSRTAAPQLVLWTDDLTPLLGLQGTSATWGGDRGADLSTAQFLENRMGAWVDAVRRDRPEPQDLLSGKPIRLDRATGAGSGGGVGYALLLLGARYESAVAGAARLVGLSGEVARADLVVCATPRVDWAAMAGSVVSHAAQVAAEYAVPAVAISPVVQVGRRELMAMGLSGSYQVAGSGAVGWRERAAQVAVTWSRRRG
jgi:glycerate kinase